jgi:bifunctional non-homologous end joining protein LigD
MNREKIDYVVIENLAGMVWVANLAALELHTPQWTVGPRGAVRGTDLLVFDLDPGAPATITECTMVACILREELAKDGLVAFPKTSGSKGMQVSVPIREAPGGRTSDYAKMLAGRLAAAHPKRITAEMAKAVRPGKVFVDWSQNNTAKTTICVYSLRARVEPRVSTPLTWDEVVAGGSPSFTAAEVLERIEEYGDLHAGALQTDQELPA